MIIKRERPKRPMLTAECPARRFLPLNGLAIELLYLMIGQSLPKTSQKSQTAKFSEYQFYYEGADSMYFYAE